MINAIMKVKVDCGSIDRLSQLRDKLKTRMAYNSHDLGDMGKFVRLQYINNFIDDFFEELIIDIEVQDDRTDSNRDNSGIYGIGIG